MPTEKQPEPLTEYQIQLVRQDIAEYGRCSGGTAESLLDEIARLRRQNDLLHDACARVERAAAPMTRDQAIEIARAAAKAKPKSYYAEPFEPHEWVVDAILVAANRDALERDQLRAEANITRDVVAAARAWIKQGSRARRHDDPALLRAAKTLWDAVDRLPTVERKDRK